MCITCGLAFIAFFSELETFYLFRTLSVIDTFLAVYERKKATPQTAFRYLQLN